MFSSSEQEVQVPTINSSDCCGNGCAQCILDIKPKQSTIINKTGKKNVISNYKKFKLLSKKHYAELADVLDLHFSATTTNMSGTADNILYIPAGHHIMMRAPITELAENSKTNLLLRPYSPYWVDVIKMEFKILVNLKPQGTMTKYIVGLHVDDEVEFRGPIGNYEHHNDGNSTTLCLVIITQGVAIGPTIPIVEEILYNEDDMTRIYHLACFRDLKHIYFRDRLREFNNYWNFKGRIYLSQQCCNSIACATGCTDKCEYFTKNLQYKELIYPFRLEAQAINDVSNAVSSNCEKIFIVCGTRTFQEDMVQIIKKLELNVKDENLHLL